MATNRFVDNVRFDGVVTFGQSPTKQFDRNALKTESKTYPVNPFLWKRHNNVAAGLGSSGSGADLGLDATSFGSDVPRLTTSDVKATSSTRYGRQPIAIPAEYEAGESIKLRVSGGMKNTVADGSCNVDFEAYLIGRDGLKSGSDLISTGAQSINSLTFADKDFTIDGTSLSPGDVLDVRIAIIYVDTATATTVTGMAAVVELICNVQG